MLGLAAPPSEHLTFAFSRGAQGCHQIVVRPALDLAGAHRQQRRGSIQGLDLRFLVNTEHHGVIGRMHVEADDVADLGNQQRVGRELEGRSDAVAR